MSAHRRGPTAMGPDAGRSLAPLRSAGTSAATSGTQTRAVRVQTSLGTAVSTVVKALVRSAPRSQARRDPEIHGVAATSAPTRYPTKLADASKPASAFVS